MTKYTVEELCNRFYPLRYLIAERYGMIMFKENAFWKPENNKNRVELIQDLQGCRLGQVRGKYFDILNRFEHGDAYGIDKGGEA